MFLLSVLFQPDVFVPYGSDFWVYEDKIGVILKFTNMGKSCLCQPKPHNKQLIALKYKRRRELELKVPVDSGAIKFTKSGGGGLLNWWWPEEFIQIGNELGILRQAG